jgi:RND family efflux transporter MFP subunit
MAAVHVAVATAHAEPLPEIYRASGTVRGRATITVTSKAWGYVRAVHVVAGDRVTAGQVLVDLEANDVRAGVTRSRAELDHAVQARAEAESGLEAARVDAELAKTTRDRVTRLLSSGAITRQAYDEVESKYRASLAQQQMAEARLRAASSGIAVARAGLAEGQATLDYAHVVAPFAGRVVDRKVDAGALAAPGMPLLVLDDEAGLRVEAAVDESRGAEIHLGDPVTIELGTPGAAQVGAIGEIVPNVDVRSRAFLVKIDLPGAAHELRPGAFARVGFQVGVRPRLVVPATVITASGALDRVFVVDHGVARLRMITRGEAQGAWAEVLSGLAAGEAVVADPPRELRDGSPVEVRS